MTSPRTRVLAWEGLTTRATVAGEGPLVLLLHGFPDQRQTWDHQVPALVAAGFRVVAPDLRGYAPGSVPPDGDCSLSRLARDVLAWMDLLGAERAHVAGHDWGAAIAWALAALAPHRVERVCALAVPPLSNLPRMVRRHPTALLPLWYMALFQVPGLAERALLARDGALVRLLWRRWSPGFSAPEPRLRSIIDALSQPGVAGAVLSYYRALASPRSAPDWRLLRAPVAVPALAIAGARDGCLDPALLETAAASQPSVRAAVIPDAGHFLHLEQPEALHALLIPWLRG
ncbi:MAG: alpha/beta hydrolase [Deltaproteobacteria bacterium]|nr:alpha/beta hydrolase [Deltaproteobacteria bacterium]MCB9786606.1 alpha/beta hydrolase [Deltaproteobacteria bacterium]